MVSRTAPAARSRSAGSRWIAISSARPTHALTHVLRTRAELRDALATADRPIGLVPTMGWLHDGHRALIAQARAADATTVVSIFVNPRQFNVGSDFNQYPRNEARDLAICEA